MVVLNIEANMKYGRTTQGSYRDTQVTITSIEDVQEVNPLNKKKLKLSWWQKLMVHFRRIFNK